MCQEIKNTQKKQKEKLVMPLESQFILYVIIVEKNHLLINLILLKRKTIFALWNVIQNIEKKFYHFINNQHIKVLEKIAKVNKYIQKGMQNHTQKELHILKLEGMQERKMQKVVILLKNGKTLKRSLIINVLSADLKNLLLKTTLSLYRLVEQITLAISNLFVEIAIVGNGKNIIFENKELLK